MHYTEYFYSTDRGTGIRSIPEQKRQRAAAIAYAFTSNANRVRTYVETQRKKITYALICRCAKSLKISRAQVCDSLASLGMR